MGSTRCGPASATFWQRLLRCRSGELDSPPFVPEDRCAKSSSTPKPPASIPCAATAWSKSAVSRLVNRMPTGQTFHRYINPEREMAAEAFAVHGLSTEFLADKPLFHEVVEEFLAFIGDAPLVIHNASFDISFINAELDRVSGRRSRASGWSIRCCWPGASIPAFPTGSMISARVMRSTIHAAPSMARCSTPSFWPKSMST